MAKHRATDEIPDNLISRLYMRFTPYLQIIGFVILCTFVATGRYHKYEAYAGQIEKQDLKIKTVEDSINEIKDTLTDIRIYLGVPKYTKKQEH